VKVKLVEDITWKRNKEGKESLIFLSNSKCSVTTNLLCMNLFGSNNKEDKESPKEILGGSSKHCCAFTKSNSNKGNERSDTI